MGEKGNLGSQDDDSKNLVSRALSGGLDATQEGVLSATADRALSGLAGRMRRDKTEPESSETSDDEARASDDD